MNFHKVRFRGDNRLAFTMVELLVAVAIIALLAGLSLAGWSAAVENTKKTAELSAARQIMVAYLRYPVDNNGRLMPGIDTTPVKGESGNLQAGYISKRWPARLGELLDYRYEGVALVNEALDNYIASGADGYIATLYPSFGLNTTFVGGNYDTHFGEPIVGQDEATYGQFAVTRLNQAVQPSTLIVFVSASSIGAGGTPTYGNFYVRSPGSQGVNWPANYNENTNPISTGFVHTRWDGKAIAAHLDGSVALLDYGELQDMTRWSNQAAKAGDPNWALGD